MILIHFLQRRAQVQTVSTLFLLQRAQRESTSGRRFDRLVNSIPLWLQILAVVLVTWLLAQPRYVKTKSTQRIAIVLDSSASMGVFKSNIPDAIKREITQQQGNAAHAEIWLMESDPAKSKIYQGNSLDEMLQALNHWHPTSGAISPDNALRVTRSLIGAEGALNYITDTPLSSPAPYNTSTIAIGEKTDNCGITGVSFEQRGEQLIWKAIIRNYSSSPQSRNWQLETKNGSSRQQTIHLNAGQLSTIQGVFPPDSKRCRVSLSPDAFKLDDQLPLVRPSPKPLVIYSELATDASDFARRFQSSFPNLQPTKSRAQADLVLSSTSTTPNTQHLIVFPRDQAPTRPYLKGSIVASKHPLTDGLNWQTLLAKANPSLPHNSSDEVLLWQGNRALLYLRTHPTSKRKALIFNFDILQSNALKQPATAVLLLRFCEQLRQEKIAPETRITETSEPISLSYHSHSTATPLIYSLLNLDGSVIQASTPAPPLTAPEAPSFFTISQGNEMLFSSACHFADTREADFSRCKTDTRHAPQASSAIDRHTRDDHLWRSWTCLLVASLLGAWHFTKSGT